MGDVTTAIKLKNRGAIDKNILLSQAGRVVTVLAQNPDLDFDIEKIAAKAGLTEAEVEFLFRQPWFGDMLMERCRRITERGVFLAVDVMMELAKGGESQRIRLDAAGKIVNAYKALVDATRKHDEGDSEDEVKKFISSLKVANAEFKDESTGTLPTHHDSAQDARDQGQDPTG